MSSRSSCAAVGLAVALACLVVAPGCKPKEVTRLQRAEANHLATEAQLSSQLRDYASAEKALARAVELDPEIASFWLALGLNRARLGDKAGARKAYKKSVSIHEKAYKKDPKNVDAVLSQIEPLVLAGRADEARKLIEKAGRDHAGHPSVIAVTEDKIVDRLLEDPKVKAVMVER